MSAFRWLPLSLLVLVLGACATGGGTVEQIDASTPRALAEEGDFRGAAAAYEQLAKRNRRQRDALLLSAAEALREEGDWDAVESTLERVRRKNLFQPQVHRADLLLAEAALARGDSTTALTLAVLPDDEDDVALRIRAAEVRARALAANGQIVESAMERVRLNALLPAGERAANENELLETLAGADVKLLADTVGDLPPADPLRPWLERAVRLKGAVPPRVIPRPTRQAGTLLPDGTTYSREGYVAATRVALLLPLTGPLAPAGAAVRDGFMAAYFADKDSRPGVRVFDAGASIETAMDAYRLAVADGSVRVIGPLAREQVAAVQSSPELTIPLLALNHPEDGTAPPVGSQQFGLLPDDEAALAAEYAISRNLRRASVLTATEEWSERAALAFRAQFEQLGGEVVGESRLPAMGVDYSGSISEASAGGPPDVVFLAVRPAQGRLVVPQLRARGTPTPILATSHIYAGSVNRQLDRDLNDVEFCDAPWLFNLATGVPARDSLARKLTTAAGNPRLFAFGMDAYRLLPYLDWLAGNPDAYLPGASGQLAIDEFGRVRRLLTWMRFSDGVPRSADGALSPEEEIVAP
jgi:uncharacterized protein